MASSQPLKKNTAVTIVFPIYDADGDLVGGATGLDSEYSLDGGTFSDCTNEATNMTSAAANTGIYSLALVAGETNGDVVCIQVKTTSSGAKTTVLVFYTAARTVDDLAFPTTSGRSLDVTATGAAGIDWANVENPTTALNLSGTNIDTDQVVASVSGAVNSVTNAVTVGTNNDKTGYSIADATSDAVIADAVWNALVASYGIADSYGALIETNLDTTISSRSTLTAAQAADQVWDEAIADHLVAGSTGATLNSASAPSAAAVADAVWDELLSGHIVAGSAGEAVGAILREGLNLI